jgi:group II intron reverse transcriptase/maturase
MNVTKNKIKDRQLHIEGYLQMVSAEQKEYAEVSKKPKVSIHSRITENNDIITDFQMDTLLEQILQSDNLNKAYKKVKSNKGAGGVDGMSVDELLSFLKDNQKKLVQKLKNGKYKPNPVRRVEIPKETKGEIRKLGVPTVVDRVFQQAMTQVLSPIYEEQFSENSYGFRPKRGAHDALKQCQQNVNDGYVYVVDMDLEKFFDTVCQSKLIEVLSRTIKDGRVISLIHKYLNAGVISNGMFEKTDVGMPQGGPLSPLLSNIMLNELDKELERRGHRFVRYADDCMIFCKSKKSAERTLVNIMPYIEGKLFLKVNRQKTNVAHISKVKYLGYSFYRYKGKCRLRVHPKSIAKMNEKLKELTSRNNGWGNEYRALKLTQFIRGWVNYFGLADMKSMLSKTDEWLRHRIRCIYWKQWKKVKTKFSNLKKLGVEEEKAWICANMRNGNWYCSGYFVLQTAFNNKKLRELGFITLTEHYLKISEN